MDFYKRLELLLGFNLSGHTDTLAEASNLIDEICKQGEIEKEQQNLNVFIEFQSR